MRAFGEVDLSGLQRLLLHIGGADDGHRIKTTGSFVFSQRADRKGQVFGLNGPAARLNWLELPAINLLRRRLIGLIGLLILLLHRRLVWLLILRLHRLLIRLLILRLHRLLILRLRRLIGRGRSVRRGAEQLQNIIVHINRIAALATNHDGLRKRHRADGSGKKYDQSWQLTHACLLKDVGPRNCGSPQMD